MTLEELAAIVAAQAIEIQRLADMVQTLSESHDLNRRELQAATKTARDFTNEMEQHVIQATLLHAEVVAERKNLKP